MKAIDRLRDDKFWATVLTVFPLLTLAVFLVYVALLYPVLALIAVALLATSMGIAFGLSGRSDR